LKLIVNPGYKNFQPSVNGGKGGGGGDGGGELGGKLGLGGVLGGCDGRGGAGDCASGNSE